MLDISEIVKLVGGRLHRPVPEQIVGFAPLDEATKGQLSFYGNAKYFNAFAETKASIVIVDNLANIPDTYGGALLEVEQTYSAVSTLLGHLGRNAETKRGVDSSAIVSELASLAAEAYIGPQCIVGPYSNISAGTQLLGQVYVGSRCTIGKNCQIYPGVRILDDSQIGDNCIIQSNTVIGSDGFGYTPDTSGKLQKIPQIGKVIIEDNVEIGANCAIDRGSMKDTVIRTGVKLDNLIQIAHNVEIGANTVIAAQTGIAGSTTLGQWCMIGGQVGIVGHLKIGDQTQIQAQSGMIKSVAEPNTKWYGYPAIEYKNYLKSYAQFKNLPTLVGEIQDLKSKLRDLLEKIENIKQ